MSREEGPIENTSKTLAEYIILACLRMCIKQFILMVAPPFRMHKEGGRAGGGREGA